jgi:site-specific recombinase XerD
MKTVYIEPFSEWLTIKGYSSKTVESFSRVAIRFMQWLEKQDLPAGRHGIEPEQVSYNDILAYIHYCKNKGHKQRTVQISINVLKHFYTRLLQEEYIADNPVSNVLIKGIRRTTLHKTLTTEELEHIYKSYNTEKINYKPGMKVPPQYNNELARKRNKIILGLIIYQGIRTEELARLELQDLQLREGKITIQGSKRTEGRTMKLESHQMYDLTEYVHNIRKQIVEVTQKNTTKLFISVGQSLNFNSIMYKLVKVLKMQHPQLKDIKQIRTSVIVNWLKIYNLRKTQYLAGHRYVSSTEKYQINNIEALQDEVKKYHPIG